MCHYRRCRARHADSAAACARRGPVLRGYWAAGARGRRSPASRGLSGTGGGRTRILRVLRVPASALAAPWLWLLWVPSWALASWILGTPSPSPPLAPVVTISSLDPALPWRV